MAVIVALPTFKVEASRAQALRATPDAPQQLRFRRHTRRHSDDNQDKCSSCRKCLFDKLFMIRIRKPRFHVWPQNAFPGGVCLGTKRTFWVRHRRLPGVPLPLAQSPKPWIRDRFSGWSGIGDERIRMADSVLTRPSLLARIKDTGDRQAWAEFVDIYAPLIYGFVLKQGLQDADAADLTQEVLGAVARSAARFDYDPTRGTFRGWLFRMVRNELSDFGTTRKRHRPGTGDTDVKHRLEAQPAPSEDEVANWERDYQRQLFALACEQVRGDFQESTWQAFWRTAIQGQSGKAVAGALRMTTAAVYLAKRRVTERLKQQIQYLRAE